MRSELSSILLLLALCAFLFFYGLSSGELWRTENLRAIIAAEFLRTGNWIVPTLYGEPLFTKPPGMYAAIALASWPFGQVSEWTARLPSALAATATVSLVYWYFRRQLGRLAGLVAGAVLPASFMWLDKVPTAEIDMLQVAWVTAAILFFLRAIEEDDPGDLNAAFDQFQRSTLRMPRSSLGWWLAALFCVAGGILTKWTAPAFFYCTAVTLLWRRGRLRLLWSWQHLAGVALAAAICLGWIAAAVAQAGWEPLYETVSREALQRLSPSHHQEAIRQMSPGHHPPLYPWAQVLVHPFRILGATLPWSVFALLTLRPGFSSRWSARGQRLLQALHCWTWPNLFFWSILPEHAARHSFPMFPGITGLAAMVFLDWLRPGEGTNRRTALWAGRGLVGMLAVWLAIKIVFVHQVIPGRNVDRQPRAKGEQLAAVVPAGETLYLLRLKDEGIMFYYRRPVRRVAGLEQLPSSVEPLYCILDASEWAAWSRNRRAEAVLHLRDEQGDPIVLVRMLPA
jgi:4-amino-4-deoxy-L-arabinose transferase-like glycosyltransferase